MSENARPIVAVVGRPNVGKSTLFNRLAGKRLAIVEDIPGTTRDRVYANIVWQDQDIILVDTGGLELDASSDISRRVKNQVEIAIREADAIVMLVDVKDGVTIPDLEIAETLRRSKKPVVLAVNKCDNDERLTQAIVFHEIPLDDPISISAYHGTGVPDMMERIVEALPPSPHVSDPDILKIAIVGRPNVGKSMLLNALLGQDRCIVSDVPGTTRDSIDTILEQDDRRVLLIDTAGIRRRGRIDRGIEKYSVMRAMRSIERADVVLLVLDASEMLTAQDAHVAGFIRDAYKGILLVVNKWDLSDDLGLRKRDSLIEIQKNLRFLTYAPMIFISALERRGLGGILAKADEIIRAQRQDIAPDELRRVIRRALEEHPPTSKRPFSLHDVKQVKKIPPTFIFTVSRPEMVHFSYRRYLENRIREAFNYTGTPLRLVFEKKKRRRK